MFDIVSEEDALATLSQVATQKKGRYKSVKSFEIAYRRALKADNDILFGSSSKKNVEGKAVGVSLKKKDERKDEKFENQFAPKSLCAFKEHRVSILCIQNENMKNGRKKNSSSRAISNAIQKPSAIAASNAVQVQKSKKPSKLHQQQKEKKRIKPLPIEKNKPKEFKPLSPAKANSPAIKFENSEIILDPDENNYVTVSKQLAVVLKSHQIEGIKFMFKNICGSISTIKPDASESIRGCILAHNMGKYFSKCIFSEIKTTSFRPSLC